MQANSLFLGEFTRKELGESIANGIIKGAIVPTGALEQHQDHLSMIHDTVSVTEIAERVARQFSPHVLVAPTVPMSVSEHHMAHGGVVLQTVHGHVLAITRQFLTAVGHFADEHEVGVHPGAAVLQACGQAMGASYVGGPHG